MGPIELLEALRNVIAYQLRELHLPVQPGKSWDEDEDREPGIFLHQLPERTGDGPGLADKRAPYVLLQVLTVTDDAGEGTGVSDRVAVVRMLAATYGDDSCTATQALINLFERLRLYLLRWPVFGNHFTVRPPLSYEIYPEEKTTFAYGDMVLNVEMPGVERVVDLMHMPPPRQQPTEGGKTFGW